MANLDYQSWDDTQISKRSHRVRLSYVFSITAMVLMLIGVFGINGSKFNAIGFLFGALILVSWIIAFIGIVIAALSLAAKEGRRGLYALLFGVAVIGLSFILGTLFPGPGLGNIH